VAICEDAALLDRAADEALRVHRDLSDHDARDHVRAMFSVDEPTAAATCKVYVESGAVVKLRRRPAFR
jgi:hypothetical protein